MSGVRVRHLERRCGIYGLRVRVPDEIRPLVGMVEVRRSQRTSDLYRARAQSSLQAARLFAVFEMVRSNQDQVNRDEVQAIIAAALHEVANMMAPPPRLPDRELPFNAPLTSLHMTVRSSTKPLMPTCDSKSGTGHRKHMQAVGGS